MERLPTRARPIGLAIMAIPALALIGAPFTSGSVAKDAIKTLAVALPEGWTAPIIAALSVAAIGTTLLMFRLFATLPTAPRTA